MYSPIHTNLESQIPSLITTERMRPSSTPSSSHHRQRHPVADPAGGGVHHEGVQGHPAGDERLHTQAAQHRDAQGEGGARDVGHHQGPHQVGQLEGPRQGQRGD